MWLRANKSAVAFKNPDGVHEPMALCLSAMQAYAVQVANSLPALHDFVEPVNSSTEYLSTRTFVNPNIRQPNHLSTQTFVNPNICRPKHSSTS
jgi:hypothetical protein